jgi:chromosome segregation ATPase
MSEDSLTVHILREIREEVRSTNQRLDSTNQRLDSMGQRLDSMDQRLGRLERGQANLVTRDELFVSELRTATRLNELTATSRNLHAYLEENLQLRDRVERCEHDIADLKGRGH